MCVMKVQLPAEVVVCGCASLPVMQVTILVLKLGHVAVKDGVVPTFLFDEHQEFVAVLVLFWIFLKLLLACWVWGREGRERGVGGG